MQPAVEFKKVDKRFGKVQALKQLSFSVKSGESFALLGPNGAGKSTTLSILSGLRTVDSGKALIFGKPPANSQSMREMGILPQNVDFPEQLTPRELIHFTMAHFPKNYAFKALVEIFSLNRLLERRVMGFSGGERRRLALALAFAGDPKLIFLDEPTTGLDNKMQKAFGSFIHDYLSKGKTLIMTSHNFHDIENICNHIILIDHGKRVFEGSISDIRKAVDLRIVRFDCENPSDFIKKNFTYENSQWKAVLQQPESILRHIFEDGDKINNLTIENLPLDSAIEIARKGDI